MADSTDPVPDQPRPAPAREGEATSLHLPAPAGPLSEEGTTVYHRRPRPATETAGPAAEPAQADLSSFGDYEALHPLARGGMGLVYRARHKQLRRSVALKMILAGRLASDEDVERFHREAQAAAQLDHPGIVPIYEVGTHQGQHFYAMGLVEGGSLEALVREGPLPPRRAAALVEQVAEALDYAHGKGIVHRDLKPGNVLLDQDGRPRVTDFGLARQVLADSRLTVSGQVLGTPSYMPPEQAAGRADVGPAADVYALGALLYCLLTGRPPFQAATPVETLRQVLDHDPVAPRQLNAAVDRDLETVCLKCLQKEPARRYPSARALAEDLGRFRRGEPIHARPVGRLERLGRWCRRYPAVAALLAALFAVLTVGLALVSWQWGEAVAQRHRAEEKTADEARARVKAQRAAASLLLERGLALCQQAEYDRGALWMVRGLELAPDEAPDLCDALRTLLGGWSARLCPCELVLAHSEGVRAAALSADQRFVVTAGGATAQVWDARTGQPVGQPLRHAPKVYAAALSPDGRLVLTGGEGAARLWEAATGRPAAGPLQHGGAVEHVAFSPDGRVALTGSKDNTARLWDATTGRPLGAPLAHQDVVRAVAFSPDGRLALTGSNDATAQVWEVPTGRPVGPRLRHEGAVRGVAFSPDGKQVLSGSNDRTARLWEVASGKRLATLTHTKPVPGVAFRPDGRAVATGSEAYSAREWDARTGQPLGPPLRHDEEVARVAYSPDGRLLLTSGWHSDARLWEAGTDHPAAAPLRHHGSLTAAAFGPDGRTVLTAGGRTARLWRVPFAVPPTPFPRQARPVQVVAFSPDGATVLAAAGEQAWLWKAATGERVAGPLAHTKAVLAGAFSPDGRAVLTGSMDGSAWLWGAATGRPLAGPFRHPDPVYAVAFRPDGQAFATGSGQSVMEKGNMKGRGEARVWGVASGQVIQSAPRHARDTLAVAFTPDGQTLATASKDGTARFWDVATGEARGAVVRHRGWVNVVALTHDGRAALTASDDATARLWTVPDATPLTLPLRHLRPVKAAAVSCDGRLLLTASEDGTAQLWGACLGQPAGEPFRPLAPVTAAAFSPTGRAVLTGDRDGWVRLWEVPAPLGGDAEQVRLQVETMAGAELDETGALRPLGEGAWNERRGRLGAAP
jgi:WD40 repeat protein